MKNIIKYVLQKILGLHNYLFLFAGYVIFKFPFDKKEKGFLKFLELVNNSGTVLDIGANIGVTTYYFSRKLPNSMVYSFEPIKDNLKALKSIIAKFGVANVEVRDFALGDRNGRVDMVMPESNNIFFHGLSHVKRPDIDEKGKLYNVEIKKLDDIKELHTLKINAIKIDVEDYEFNVFKGGEQLIQKNRPMVYCELWESENRRKCFDFFDELNYKTYIYHRRELKEYSDSYKFQNFFFIPVEYCDRFRC